MTAKQKANQARFKKVVAEAKKLRKKNPKLTQAQAVKQAWAMTYTKKKVGGYSDERNKIHKNATSWIKRYKKRGDEYETAVKRGYDQAAHGPAPKVGAIKKKAAKKSSSYHKDTKSHNVNIRVMSGISSYWLDRFNETVKIIQEREKMYEFHKELSKRKDRPKFLKDADKKTMIILKSQLTDFKKDLTQIKKKIK